MIEAGFEDFANRSNPILNVFDAEGVRFAHEVHLGLIAYPYGARRGEPADGQRTVPA